MHELSIVLGIVELAEQRVAREDSPAIEEIVLDIGALAAVDMDAFDFAWRQATRNTLLAGAARVINHIPGMARCLDCQMDFAIQNIYDPCPACGGHLITVIAGRELRVRSLVIH